MKKSVRIVQGSHADWVYECAQSGCGERVGYGKKPVPPPVCHYKVMKLTKSPEDDY